MSSNPWAFPVPMLWPGLLIFGVMLPVAALATAVASIPFGFAFGGLASLAESRKVSGPED